MNVKEAIKNNNNFVITRNGIILGINNISDKLLNVEVKKVQVVKGLINDVTCVRV